jgi:hypothetical protein
VVHWSLLIPALVLLLGCKKGPVLGHCDNPLNSNMAYGEWVNAWDRQDRDQLDRCAACLVEGCKLGETNACSDLVQLCNHPIRSLDESLTKTGACSVPGVTSAVKQRPK